MRRRGFAIAVVMQVISVVLILAIALLVASDTNSSFVRLERRSLQASYNAESGVQMVLKDIYDRMAGATVRAPDPNRPFSVLDSYDADAEPFNGTLKDADGSPVGTFSVEGSVAPSGALDPLTDDPRFLAYKNVTLTATGTAEGFSRRLRVTARVGFLPSSAFGYAMYINNYWYLKSPSSFACLINGNVGANGYCDVLGAGSPWSLVSPIDNGNPTYDSSGNVVSMASLSAALDFRYSTSPTTVAIGTVPWRDSLGNPVAARPRAPFIQMPSLADLTYFKALAAAGGGTLTGGSPAVSISGVSGSENVLLDGRTTALNINGMVVIPGDAVIRGRVRGKGTLYVGRNLYIAGNLQYGIGGDYATAGPAAARPRYTAGQDPAAYYQALQNWLATVGPAYDCVSYCAAGNMVLGDVSNSAWWTQFRYRWGPSTSPTWSYYYSAGGVRDVVTASSGADMREDSGTDKIWGSGDATEGDGKWTVQVDDGTGFLQTRQFDPASIPVGTAVIPGTGEDLDGDGKYTPACQYSDFAFRPTAPVTSFAGWPGTTSYSTFLGDAGGMLHAGTPPWAYPNYLSHIDGYLFCNHIIAGPIGTNFGPIVFHGGYATRGVGFIMLSSGNTYEHDERIDGTIRFGQTLPGVPGLVQTRWQENP